MNNKIIKNRAVQRKGLKFDSHCLDYRHEKKLMQQILAKNTVEAGQVFSPITQ